MLEVLDLESIRGERRLFRQISFSLASGELLFLQGKNGSGKTTLLRLLVGLSQPTQGEIRWQGRPIHKLGSDYRAQLCYLGHQNAIKEELTPLENLISDTQLFSQAKPLSEDDAMSALGKMGLATRADLPCKFLSQGQKRRVALSRLIHERRSLWVLDEAFVALDTAAVELVASLLGAHLDRGGLAVMTTHQQVDIPVASEKIRHLTLVENT